MPKEINQPELSTYSLPGVFFVSGTGVVFRTPVNGATTSGSSYPRTELRQMKSNGQEASWSNQNHTWAMQADMAFTHLPDSPPNCVGMQIHGGTDDVTVLRLEGTNLYVTQGDNPHYQLIQSGYVLGTVMTVGIQAQAGGNAVWYLNGSPVATVTGGPWSGCYFKAGCYPQSNSGGGYGETIFYGLAVQRT